MSHSKFEGAVIDATQSDGSKLALPGSRAVLLASRTSRIIFDFDHQKGQPGTNFERREDFGATKSCLAQGMTESIATESFSGGYSDFSAFI